jgi:alkylation response protein AidB-like acyl-CoA dehydrogenase
MACFEIAADYASKRVQLGNPIAGYQLVQSRHHAQRGHRDAADVQPHGGARRATSRVI